MMGKIILLIVLLTGGTSAYTQNLNIPYLKAQGSTKTLMVKDKPFLILGGELHNSSTSGAGYMNGIWKQMKKKNLNTVIAAVYWELLEPTEGKFDFSLVDSMILGARKENLHLIILWFGSWKNGYSMYAPGWVKTDTQRFPRVKNKKGEPFAVLSAFSKNSMKADAAAFGILMKHIREVDGQYQTVIMAQVENEVGLFYEPKDNSEEAVKEYNKGVPKDLMAYLVKNKGALQPELDSAWRKNGYKTSGKWDEVFGESVLNKENWKALSYLPEELFTSYAYSKYIGQVAAAGKAAYPIPMYVNAWVKQPGFYSPGKYPSGGPVPHTLDIWRCNAPAIDLIAPDIYLSIPDTRYTIEQYSRPGNPVLIPEILPSAKGANLAFWAFGQMDALCYSPFGIDETKAEDDPITETYRSISKVEHLILQHRGNHSMQGIYVDTLHKFETVKLNNYEIKASLWLPISAPVGGAVAGLTSSTFKPASAGGIIFANGADEFIVIGKDFRLTFTPLTTDPAHGKIDVLYTEEGTYLNEKWQTKRRLNGDEGTGGGDYGFNLSNGRSGSLKFPQQPSGEYSIVKIKFYRY